jgi:hypothetical protein
MISMGVGYCLINNTKKECISYIHIPANTAKELTGNPVAAAITSWYLLKNSGDEIGFVPDQYNEKNWTYKDVSEKEILNYKDLTDEIVEELIELKILENNGIAIIDEDEPELYMRRLESIWMK